jgi:hypothetical protein
MPAFHPALAALLTLAFAGAAIAAGPPAPAELLALAAKSRLAAPVAGWCRGELRPGYPGGFAVAIRSAKNGGRYLVLNQDGTVFELASYSGSAELACYTPAEALKLDATIGSSQTVHGKIAPAGSTTVICGFVDATSAVCWQYSPAAGKFVKVGEWIT